MHRYLQRLLLLGAFLWGALFQALAQQGNIQVAGDITEDAADQTANTAKYIVKDLNDKPCALIKVETTQKGMKFDIGSSTMICKTEVQNAEHPAEVWLWVPEGTRRLNIQHPLLGKKTYQFPSIRTKSGCTYLIKLVTGQVETRIKEAVHQGYLNLHIEPRTASVSINGESVMLDEEGRCAKFLEFGTYDIQVTASNYHPYVRRYTHQSAETQELNIRLRPAFGWLTIKDTTGIAGARVFVDDELLGEVPVGNEGLRSGNLKSGQHRVRVERKLYNTYTAVVTVTDSATTTLCPTLEANFATTRVTCSDPEAYIYINKEKRGKGSWTGPLETGSYQFEARRDYHTPVTRSLTITKKNMGEAIVLDAPSPINGSLRISSQPLDATVEIDGVVAGRTPLYKSEILTGPHTLRFTRSGFSPKEVRVVVQEAGTAEVSPTLSTECSFMVSASTDGLADSTHVYVTNAQGQRVAHGLTPFRVNNVPVGLYTFRAERDGFAPFCDSIDCQGQNVRLALKRTRKVVTIRSNRYIPYYLTTIDGRDPSSAERIDDRQYKFALDYGVHSFKIDAKREKGSKTFRVDENSPSEIEVTQHYQYVVPNMFYIDLGSELINTTAVHAAMGFFAKNVNVEFDGTYSLAKKQNFYVVRLGTLTSNLSSGIVTYEIKLVYSVGGRVGYGFRLGNRVQLTPQVGADYHNFSLKKVSKDENHSTYAVSGVGGVRVFLAMTHHIGLQVSPQYRFVLSQSKDFKAISSKVSEAKKWVNGFGLRADLVFFW